MSTLFNQTVINKYDMMVISCHGESATLARAAAAEKQIVKNFVDAGGRVFASHFSFGYFRGVAGTTDAKNFQPTPWPLLAEWDGNPRRALHDRHQLREGDGVRRLAGHRRRVADARDRST